MSKYFKTLERLRAIPSEASSIPPPERSIPAPQPQTDAVEHVPIPHLHTVSEVAAHSATAQGAYAGLLDSLRLVPPSACGRCVLIAGASSDKGTYAVLRGLEEQAEQRAANLVTGELQLSQGSRQLTLRRIPASSDLHTEVAGQAAPLDLDDEDLSTALRNRIEAVSPEADVAILYGPPLFSSVDGALLARATSGLVLVVEPLETRRTDLLLALKRAESSGCSVIGIVTFGARQWVPGWIQRLLSGTTS